ncbi:hypothetical protein PTKIN_Ptkin07bG0052600 [Pterospermum kingtungense]
MSSPPSSEGSVEENLDLRTMSLGEVDPIKLLEKDVVIHDSDDDNYDSRGSSFDMNMKKQIHADLKLETGPENPTEHAT